MDNLYRIDDYCLLRETKTYEAHRFHKYNEQYVLQDEEQWTTNLDSAVWFSGDYAHRLNRVYDEILYDPKFVEYTEPYSTHFQLYLRQGFTFRNLFGILFVAQDMTTEEVLVSRLLTQNDFTISDTKELVNGTFWIQMCDMLIPRTDNNVQVQVAYVTYDDVDMSGSTIGLIHNYPIEFIPLISEKPYPDFIRTSVEFDTAHFIVIRPYTTENKTLEQSILDYFGVTMANISIEHQIRYGNISKGYKTLVVSNGDNPYGEVNVGLNLVGIATEEEPEVNIFITTQITVDSKMMRRDTSITTNIYETINPVIADLIRAPETIYELRLNKQTNVVHKVIEQKTVEKIIPILQPTYIQIASQNVVFENKNITFSNVTETCYLITEKTKKDESVTIMTHRTKEGKYYFDLSEISILNEDAPFRVVTAKDSRLVQTGTLTVSQQ